MRWLAISLWIILTYSITLPAVGQVPIIAEPRPFQFDFYPNTVVRSTTAGQVHNPPASMMTTYNIPRAGASSEEQRRSADEDIRRHQMEAAQKQKMLDKANAELDEMHIDYQFPFNDLPEKKLYFDAFNYIKKVLNGDEPMNLEATIFFVEHAYDPSLNYDEFSQQLSKAANVIGLKMAQDRISPDDNLGKIMTTFRFVSDTISVYSRKSETNITSYPKTYDFEDFWGQKDYKKMFVSKLMKEGSGQCHSLPLYFLVLCERIKCDASLAFAPNHSFVKFQDKRGAWHNLELTNGMLATDHFMVESGYIKAESIQNRIYLQPLTKKQTIVQCLNDLALGYVKKYGYDPFVKACTQLAIDNDKNSLSAHQINANYFMTLDSYIRYQYKVKRIGKEVYQQDEKAKSIYESVIGANKFIERLGYTDMPQDVYEAWLKSAQNEANKQQHTKEVKVLRGMIEIK
jgi:hypothetical protein